MNTKINKNLFFIFLLLSPLRRVENLVLKDGDRSKSNACSDYNKIYEDLLLDTNSLIKHMNMKIEEYEASFIIFFSIHEFSIEFFNFM